MYIHYTFITFICSGEYIVSLRRCGNKNQKVICYHTYTNIYIDICILVYILASSCQFGSYSANNTNSGHYGNIGYANLKKFSDCSTQQPSNEKRTHINAKCKKGIKVPVLAYRG